MRSRGFNDWHPEDASQSRQARPDIFCMNSIGPDVVIEMKRFDQRKKVADNFLASDISDEQRNWLDGWTTKRNGHGYLGIGTTQGNPRRMWVIPWLAWVDLEKQLAFEKVVQGKIMQFKKHETTAWFGLPFRISTEHIDIHLNSTFELTWVGGEHPKWEFKEGHPILDIKAPERKEDDWDCITSYRFNLDSCLNLADIQESLKERNKDDV